MTKREKIEELRGEVSEQVEFVEWLATWAPYMMKRAASAGLDALRAQLAALESEERDE